jgi:hypothetical protein
MFLFLFQNLKKNLKNIYIDIKKGKKSTKLAKLVEFTL